MRVFGLKSIRTFASGFALITLLFLIPAVHAEFSLSFWNLKGGHWTWMAGPNTPLGAPNYGSPGVANPSNVPGSRLEAATWTDAAGKMWLFGGFGKDST